MATPSTSELVVLLNDPALPVPDMPTCLGSRERPSQRGIVLVQATGPVRGAGRNWERRKQFLRQQEVAGFPSIPLGPERQETRAAG